MTGARNPELNARDQSAPPRFRQLGAGTVIACAAALAYANSFSGVFILDDEYHIVANPRIERLWPPWEILSSRRPVVEASLAINYALGGRDVWGYHLFNLLVHVAAASVLFGLVRRTMQLVGSAEQGDVGRTEAAGVATPWGRSESAATAFAFSVALLWAVHPLQTQAVTYVIQRGESLMGLFLLLTVYCFARAVAASGRGGWLAASAAFCLMGMGCKAVMISAPFVVIAYDWTFGRRVWSGGMRRAVYYVALLATCLVPVATGIFGLIFFPSGDAPVEVGFGYEACTWWQYLATQAGVIVHYIRLCVWPSDLCFDYAWPTVRSISEAAAPGLLVVLLFGSTVWGVVRRRWWGFAGAWFFLILAPTSSIVPIRDAAFEHRMYLPSAAVIVVIVAAVHRAIRAASGARAWSRRRTAVATAGLMLAAGTALGLRTARRNEDYGSRLRMWSLTAAQRPENPRAQLNLGNALFRDDPAAAGRAYRRALAVDPDNVQARHNLGNVLLRQGDAVGAIEQYRRAVELAPDYFRSYYNMGNALRRLGRDAEAIDAYQRVLAIEPKHTSAMVNMGLSFRRLGRLEDALAIFEQAIEFDPMRREARYNLGLTLMDLRRFDEAAAVFRRVAKTFRGESRAWVLRGEAMAKAGRLPQAAAVLREAARRRPDDGEAALMLGEVLRRTGDLEGADRLLRRARALLPDDARVTRALARLHEAQGG